MSSGKKKSAKPFPKIISQHGLAKMDLGLNLPTAFTTHYSFVPVLHDDTPETNIWANVLRESDERRLEVQEHIKSKDTDHIDLPFFDTDSDYLKQEVFPWLLPALEKTLFLAIKWKGLQMQRSIFNGVDNLAQELWNKNTKHSDRQGRNMYIFNMPWVQDLLKEKPRPLYPKSWLWTEEYAALRIQMRVRAFFIQKKEEVQEMRKFWKILKEEKEAEKQLQKQEFIQQIYSYDVEPKV